MLVDYNLKFSTGKCVQNIWFLLYLFRLIIILLPIILAAYDCVICHHLAYETITLAREIFRVVMSYCCKGSNENIIVPTTHSRVACGPVRPASLRATRGPTFLISPRAVRAE